MPQRTFPARPSLLKRINAGTILARALQEGSVSRAQLARQVGISPPTVSALIGELVKQGVLREAGPGTSARGRKPVLLQVDPDGAAILVASIRPAHFAAGVSDVAANLRELQSVEYSADSPPEQTIERLATLLGYLAGEAKAQGRRLLGVGVSTPGLLRANGDFVILSPNQPRWHEVPLGHTLQERLGVPVFVDNDARAVALAEMCYGEAKGYRHVVCVAVAEGIGTGLLIDGHIYSGKSGYAGELGHTIVDPDGRRCGCGKRGCWEAMASEAALLEAVRARLNRWATSETLPQAGDLTVEGILKAAESGDPVANAAVNEVAYYLGIGLANVVNTFDPEGLVLWGRIFSYQPLVQQVRNVLEKQAFSTSLEGLDVWVSAMGEEAMLKGAAAHVLRRTLLVSRLGG